jgi:hypothetical protein
MPQKKTARPTSAQFLVAANSDDDLAMIVRAHVIFESLLMHIIMKASGPTLISIGSTCRKRSRSVWRFKCCRPRTATVSGS